jgi:signal transduction histidine kinase
VHEPAPIGRWSLRRHPHTEPVPGAPEDRPDAQPIGHTSVELQPAPEAEHDATVLDSRRDSLRRAGYASCFAGLCVVGLILLWAALSPSPTRQDIAVVALWAVGAGAGLVVAWEMFASSTELRIVWLLTFFAYAYAFTGLLIVDNAVSFLIGRIALQVAIGAFIYLTLSYPSGRLPWSAELGFWWVAALGMAVLLVACVLFAEAIPTIGLVQGCSPGACPHNPLMIDSLGPGEGHRLTQALSVWSGSCALVAAGMTALRTRDYSVRERHVFAGAIVWMTLVCALFGVVLIVRGITEGPVSLPVAIAATAILALTPAAHAIAFSRGRVMTSSRLQSILTGAEAGVGPAVVQDALARAFADPDLRLLVRQPGGYVDVDGVAADVAALGQGREVTELTRNGRPAAILIHDPLLQNDRGGLETAGAAVLLTLDNHRLQADLQHSVEELRRSRRRVAEAVHQERARIERDLHDGAQQFLIGIGHRISRLRSRAGGDPQLDGELALAADEIELALEGLRELTRGIYPPVLRILGLGPALAALARDAPSPVSCELTCDRRFAPLIEAAVYFCCSEALQNIHKHCPPTVSANLRLIADDDGIGFEISDDGPGFDVTERIASRGLAGMRDRINAVGGELYIHSARGAGTTVTGGLGAGEV